MPTPPIPAYCPPSPVVTSPIPNIDVEAAIAYNFGLERWCDDTEKLSKKVKQGLRNMGCPTGSSTAFSKYGETPYFTEEKHHVQGMRYMWLKWAAMMAEEQGV